MMKYFLHALDHIRIINDDREFNCTPERFLELDWTPEKAMFEDGTYDNYDCEPYCDKVGIYTEHPVIYADVSLSKNTLCLCDPADKITFSATLKDGAGIIIPLDYDWLIRLTHEDMGDIDRIFLRFTGGSCTAVYTALSTQILGLYYLDEDRFDLVEFNGVTYKVRLINPVKFTIYRTLS